MRRTETFASIKTRYHGATNHQGSRISITDDGAAGEALGPKRRRMVMPYDHSLNTSENHAAAAGLWIKKFIGINFSNARLAEPGLAFGGDYFWTWEFGQEGGAS